MKEESKDKVHEMKKQKLADKLEVKENSSAKKMFKEPAIQSAKPEKVTEEKKPEPKKVSKKVEEPEETETIAEVEAEDSEE